MKVLPAIQGLKMSCYRNQILAFLLESFEQNIPAFVTVVFMKDLCNLFKGATSDHIGLWTLKSLA